VTPSQPVISMDRHQRSADRRDRNRESRWNRDEKSGEADSGRDEGLMARLRSLAGHSDGPADTKKPDNWDSAPRGKCRFRPLTRKVCSSFAGTNVVMFS
jgi:hypothetical protein